MRTAYVIDVSQCFSILWRPPTACRSYVWRMSMSNHCSMAQITRSIGHSLANISSDSELQSIIAIDTLNASHPTYG